MCYLISHAKCNNMGSLIFFLCRQFSSVQTDHYGYQSLREKGMLLFLLEKGKRDDITAHFLTDCLIFIF